MIKRTHLPKPALDWGLNNSLGGIINTLLNILTQLVEPISALIAQLIGLFSGNTEA